LPYRISVRTAVGDVKMPAELLDGDPPVRIRLRIVECTLKSNRRAADQERRVDHVAVADDPADVRCRPPHVSRLQAKAPLSHAHDVHLIAAVRVNGELRLRGRSRGGEDERRLVGLHHGVTGVAARPLPEEVLPRHLIRPTAGRRTFTFEHDDPFDRTRSLPQRVVDDRQ
jgi:hypothetical protein